MIAPSLAGARRAARERWSPPGGAPVRVVRVSAAPADLVARALALDGVSGR